MPTSGSTTIQSNSIGGFDTAYVWLDYVLDDPGNPGFSRWTLKGKWGSAGSTITGDSAYVEGILNSVWVFGHAQSHPVGQGAYIVLYGPYELYTAAVGQKRRRIIACFYINSEDPQTDSYSQKVNYYIERQYTDERVSTDSWVTETQFPFLQAQFKVKKV